MQLKVLGARVALAGRFRAATRAQYERWLEALGAEVCDIDPDVDVLAIGGTPGRRFEMARALEIPIIEEDALAAGILAGEIELRAESGSASMGEVLGEVRSGLAAGDAAQVHAQLEACAPEQLETLLSYVRDQIEPESWAGPASRRVPWRWPVPKLERKEQALWEQGTESWSTQRALVELPEELTRSERITLASPSWVQQMGLADHRPWHGLTRAVSLWGTGLNGTKATRMLDSPHLEGLRHLDLGMCSKLSTTFFRTLREHPRSRGLRHLAMGRLGYDQAQALGHGAHAFESLRELTIVSQGSSNAHDWPRLFQGEFMEQIETLCLRWPSHAYQTMVHWQCEWPGLKRLIWSGARWPLEATLNAVPRLEEFVLERVHFKEGGPVAEDRWFSKAAFREPPALLDISRVRCDAEFDALLDTVIAHGPIFEGVERVRLGPHGTPENLEAMARRGVEVMDG